MISPVNLGQIIQAKCWQLTTSKEKHINCV